MSEAPTHVWLSPTETVNNKESWIDELRASHLDSYVDDSCEGVQYIRADLVEKSKDMEKSLASWVAFGKYLKNEYIIKFYANDSVALSRAIRETEELLQRLKETK